MGVGSGLLLAKTLVTPCGRDHKVNTSNGDVTLMFQLSATNMTGVPLTGIRVIDVLPTLAAGSSPLIDETFDLAIGESWSKKVTATYPKGTCGRSTNCATFVVPEQGTDEPDPKLAECHERCAPTCILGDFEPNIGVGSFVDGDIWCLMTPGRENPGQFNRLADILETTGLSLLDVFEDLAARMAAGDYVPAHPKRSLLDGSPVDPAEGE